MDDDISVIVEAVIFPVAEDRIVFSVGTASPNKHYRKRHTAVRNRRCYSTPRSKNHRRRTTRFVDARGIPSHDVCSTPPCSSSRKTQNLRGTDRPVSTLLDDVARSFQSPPRSPSSTDSSPAESASFKTPPQKEFGQFDRTPSPYRIHAGSTPARRWALRRTGSGRRGRGGRRDHFSSKGTAAYSPADQDGGDVSPSSKENTANRKRNCDNVEGKEQSPSKKRYKVTKAHAVPTNIMGSWAPGSDNLELTIESSETEKLLVESSATSVVLNENSGMPSVTSSAKVEASTPLVSKTKKPPNSSPDPFGPNDKPSAPGRPSCLSSHDNSASSVQLLSPPRDQTIHSQAHPYLSISSLVFDMSLGEAERAAMTKCQQIPEWDWSADAMLLNATKSFEEQRLDDYELMGRLSAPRIASAKPNANVRMLPTTTKSFEGQRLQALKDVGHIGTSSPRTNSVELKESEHTGRFCTSRIAGAWPNACIYQPPTTDKSFEGQRLQALKDVGHIGTPPSANILDPMATAHLIKSFEEERLEYYALMGRFVELWSTSEDSSASAHQVSATDDDVQRQWSEALLQSKDMGYFRALPSQQFGEPKASSVAPPASRITGIEPTGTGPYAPQTAGRFGCRGILRLSNSKSQRKAEKTGCVKFSNIDVVLVSLRPANNTGTRRIRSVLDKEVGRFAGSLDCYESNRPRRRPTRELRECGRLRNAILAAAACFNS